MSISPPLLADPDLEFLYGQALAKFVSPGQDLDAGGGGSDDSGGGADPESFLIAQEDGVFGFLLENGTDLLVQQVAP